jgi:hypothetical protein
MRNISTAIRGHYDDDRYMWAIIIRRFCDIADPLIKALPQPKHEAHMRAMSIRYLRD